MVSEKLNAQKFPKTYYARHMQAGLCGYDGQTVLIENDTMKRMVPSFMNKPVYVFHQLADQREVVNAEGWITESFYNPLDSWAWVKMIVTESAGQEAISKGWAVSNGYLPLNRGPGGTKHNCPYQAEILNGEFTHLALVPDPRYESALIMTPEDYRAYNAEKERELTEIHNSKTPKGDKPMFKFFKNERTEVTQPDENTMVELQNGTTVSFKELINAVEKAEKDKAEAEKKDKEKDEDKEKLNSETVVLVGEKQWKMGDLIKYYGELSNSKEPTQAEKDAESAKAKEAEEKLKKENEEGKENFNALRDANKKIEDETRTIESAAVQLKRGSERY